MSTDMRETYTYWVCEDCYMGSQGYADESDRTPDREHMSLVPETAEVTAGLWPHEDDCPNVENGEWIGSTDCECERIEFTWSSCDGCGSHLGGSRNALTVWEVSA